MIDYEKEKSKLNNKIFFDEKIFLMKKIEKEKFLKNIYKNIICIENLDGTIDYIFRKIKELYPLEEIVLIEKEAGENFQLKKSILNNQQENSLKKEIISENIFKIINNKEGFYYESVENSKKGFLGSSMYIKNNLKIIFYVAGLEKINDIDEFIIFMKDLNMIIKALYIKEIKYLSLIKDSYTDGLTKCFNRNFFEVKMADFRFQKNIGIVVFDLDCLKDINDKLGHDFGDKIIKNAVIIVNSVIEKRDILCRFGGDEFVILTINKNEEYMRNLVLNIERKFEEINKENFPIHLSIDYAMKFNKNDNIKETFKLADYRMYGKKIKNKKLKVNQVNKYIEKYIKNFN
ncbi:MAG: GGDEF domain-containing protein [Sarcina sp.]